MILYSRKINVLKYMAVFVFNYSDFFFRPLWGVKVVYLLYIRVFSVIRLFYETLMDVKKY